ncbi:MAG: hypothetical protein PVI50_08415 [Gammaproteobacteria bacterium]|jgi:hypothetical protein
MNPDAAFAYAQARLQARHGKRPTEQLWSRLASAGSLAGYLQQARETTLRYWLADMQAAPSSHAIELSLRQQFRDYVAEVAGWQPGHWKGSVYWIRRIPDLPALQYLLNGEPSPAWLREDPGLRAFAAEDMVARKEALHSSDCRYLARAWQRSEPLYEAWLEHWQRQWPGPQRFAAGLVYLARLLRRYLRALSAGESLAGDRRRQLLASGLNYTFRRHSFEPAAACAHLGLIALDLERLRGELVQRALFAETAEGQA